MKHILLLAFIAFGILGCGPGNSTKGLSEGALETSSASQEEVTVETDISYKTLRELLTNNQPIYGEYLFIDSEKSISGSINNHSILQESNKYIFVLSNNGGTDISNYYLLSFSKDTGSLIDFISAGTEAEGVESHKINWISSTSFSTVDYEYELLEDEESGAYIKGNLLDSTVQSYDITPRGLLVARE
jgi:hypothetical protein